MNLPKEKKVVQGENTPNADPPAQHIFIVTGNVDFDSSSIKKEIKKVQKEVESVMEGAIIDAQKLSYNFTL